MENNNLINELLTQIKSNKKYKSIADEIILQEINIYLKKNKIDLNKITKQDIKDIRANLHKSYSSFQTKKKNKIEKYLEELKNSNNSEITHDLLSITLSTKERINDYSLLYNQIFQITGKPKTIVDIGAGFNIFSYSLMKLDKLNYYSYDINEEDKEIINNYIKIMNSYGLTGKASIININNKDQISNLPKSDIIFLFKLIDLIDRNDHKPSEELIKQLINKTKFIVASFATTTLTRKKMNFPNRKWFELMLQRLNLKFQTITTDNEIFYVINS